MIEIEHPMGTLLQCGSCRYNTFNPQYAAAHGKVHPAATESVHLDEQQAVVEAHTEPEATKRKRPAPRRRKE